MKVRAVAAGANTHMPTCWHSANRSADECAVGTEPPEQDLRAQRALECASLLAPYERSRLKNSILLKNPGFGEESGQSGRTETTPGRLIVQYSVPYLNYLGRRLAFLR